jgi:hypothetical protein
MELPPVAAAFLRNRGGTTMPKIYALAALAVLGTTATVGSISQASSPDAWDKFRAELVQACIGKAKLPQPRVVVAPEGTASYGVALLSSEEVAGQKSQSVVCIARKTPEGLVDAEVTPPSSEWIAIK